MLLKRTMKDLRRARCLGTIVLSALALGGCSTIGARLPVPLASLPEPVAIVKLQDIEPAGQFGWPGASSGAVSEDTWVFTVERAMEVRNVAISCRNAQHKSACPSVKLKCKISNSDLRFSLEHTIAGEFLLEMGPATSHASMLRMARLDPADLAPTSPQSSKPPSYAPLLIHPGTEGEPAQWALQIAPAEEEGKARLTGYGPKDREFNLIYSDGEELYSAMSRKHSRFREVSAVLAFVGNIYAHNAGTYRTCSKQPTE